MPTGRNGHQPAESSRIVWIELDGRPLEVQVRREGRIRSPHTERELQELHGWVTTRDLQVHQWLATALRDLSERSLRSTDEAGDFTGDWLVSWNSYAEVGGLHTYTLILREREDLSLEALLLGELELHPYEYRERLLEGGLLIWAKLVGTREELERLRALVRTAETFPVVRRGIHDEPRVMRLGVAEWSAFADRVKYRLVLTDAEVNERMRLELERIEEENSRAALGFYENFIERLSELLVSRGVLSAEELSALREEARTSRGIARHEFWRVADVDAL